MLDQYEILYKSKEIIVGITTLSDMFWVESLPTARGNLTSRGGLYAVDGDF